MIVDSLRDDDIVSITMNENNVSKMDIEKIKSLISEENLQKMFDEDFKDFFSQ